MSQISLLCRALAPCIVLTVIVLISGMQSIVTLNFIILDPSMQYVTMPRVVVLTVITLRHMPSADMLSFIVLIVVMQNVFQLKVIKLSSIIRFNQKSNDLTDQSNFWLSWIFNFILKVDFVVLPNEHVNANWYFMIRIWSHFSSLIKESLRSTKMFTKLTFLWI
jgi:hypothetical protein